MAYHKDDPLEQIKQEARDEVYRQAAVQELITISRAMLGALKEIAQDQHDRYDESELSRIVAAAIAQAESAGIKVEEKKQSLDCERCALEARSGFGHPMMRHTCGEG